jgi:Flp pilus assembly pilin Flp
MNRLWKNMKAASVMEYGLLVGLIGTVGLGAVFQFGIGARDTFDGLNTTVESRVLANGVSGGAGNGGGAEAVAGAPFCEPRVVLTENSTLSGVQFINFTYNGPRVFAPNSFTVTGGTGILTVPDNVRLQWLPQTSENISSFEVTYNGTQFVAVGDGGRTLTSNDGLNWIGDGVNATWSDSSLVPGSTFTFLALVKDEAGDGWSSADSNYFWGDGKAVLERLTLLIVAYPAPNWTFRSFSFEGSAVEGICD